MENFQGLPINKTKKWHSNMSTIKENHKPISPVFCDRVDEHGKKCGNLLTGWSAQFFSQFGACEECTRKNHLDEGKFFPLEKSDK